MNLNENRLLNCIKETMKSPICLAAMRALGIFATFIPIPLWTLIDHKEKHILDLNKDWQHLINSLEKLSVDASPLLEQKEVFMKIKDKFKQKSVYKALFDNISDEIESLTKDCFEILCFDIHKLVVRQLADQISGEYSNPSAAVLEETRSCLPVNRISEKDFLDLDRDINRAPQKIVAHLSAGITYRNNKTGTYMNSLEPDKRSHLIRRAIKLAPLRRKKNNSKMLAVRKKRQELMMENKKILEEKKRKMAITVKILEATVEQLGGCWNSVEMMNSNLTQISSLKCQIRAVRDQVMYYKKVVKAKDVKVEYFRFSAKRNHLVLISSNLISLI